MEFGRTALESESLGAYLATVQHCIFDELTTGTPYIYQDVTALMIAAFNGHLEVVREGFDGLITMISSSFLSQRQAQELKTALIEAAPVEVEHTGHAEFPDFTVVAESLGIHVMIAASTSSYSAISHGVTGVSSIETYKFSGILLRRKDRS